MRRGFLRDEKGREGSSREERGLKAKLESESGGFFVLVWFEEEEGGVERRDDGDGVDTIITNDDN